MLVWFAWVAKATRLCLLAAISSLTAPLLVMGAASAAPFVLSNGPGDGSVTVGVDGYGSFGSSIGPNAENASLDRIGAGTIGTTYESAVGIRTDPEGTFSMLTSGDIGGSGLPTNPLINGGSQSAGSTFMVDDLQFFLTQTLEDIEDPVTPAAREGTLLTQTYSIVNTGNTTIDFELIRYVDFDIGDFDNDGGGGINTGGVFGETLFTNGPNGNPNPAADAVYVGITANTMTDPLTNRFETRFFPDLRGDLVGTAGYDLSDLVQGDTDGNGFQNSDDDITMVLRNTFSLAPGQVAYYTTKTIFGGGNTSPVEGTGLLGTPTVPEPGGIALVGAGVAGLVVLKHRRKRRLNA